MTALQPTNPQMNTPNTTVRASLLAKAAYQTTNPKLNALSQIVGAGLPAMAACQPTNPQQNALIPTVGAAVRRFDLLAKAACQTKSKQQSKRRT